MDKSRRFEFFWYGSKGNEAWEGASVRLRIERRAPLNTVHVTVECYEGMDVDGFSQWVPAGTDIELGADELESLSDFLAMAARAIRAMPGGPNG